jgi:hypothetical protein
MWTRLTRTTLAACTALALCACGGGEGEPEAPDATDAPSQSVFGGGEQPSGAGAPSGAASTPTWPASSVAFDDSAPEAALATYLDRLAAKDLPGAAEICDPTSPGTVELEKRATNMIQASADTGMGLSTLAGFLVEGVADATREETARTEDRVTYLVTVPGKNPTECVVVRTPDGWRVQPPPNGVPGA